MIQSEMPVSRFSVPWMALLSALPLLLFLPLVFGHHWMPKHDTLQDVMVSHVFYSDLIKNGEVLQWSPHTEAGVDLGYSLSATAYHPTLLVLWPVLKLFRNFNFLHAYYLSLILDELILLIGVYVLAKEIYRTAYARLFTTFAICGTVVWVSQVYLNFYSYFSLPLCLYLIDRGCRLQTPWRIILAFLITWIAKNFHVAQLVTLVVFLAASLFSYHYPWKKFRKDGGKWELLSVIGLVLVCIASVIALTPLLRPVIISPGRGMDGIMPYGEYLKMVSDSDLFHLGGLLTGTLESIDTTSYAGFLTPALAFLSVCCFSPRRQITFLVSALVFFLFYLGPSSFLAPLFYFIRPFTLFFRHWASFSVYLKLFLTLIAGFAVDELVLMAKLGNCATLRKCLGVLAGVLVVTAVVCIRHQKASPEEFSHFALQMTLYAACLIGLFRLGISSTVSSRLIGSFLIVLCLIDVLSYRSHYYTQHFKQFSIEKPVWELFRLRVPEFNTKRETDYFNSVNFKTISSVLFASPVLAKALLDGFREGRKDERIGFSPQVGALYNITETFLGFDPCSSIFREDFSLPMTREVYRALDAKPTPELLTALGCSAPKIQFYHGSSEGNVLQNVVPVAARNYQIDHFTPNRLSLQIESGTGESGTWLYYADSWHPHWKAKVNGIVTPIKIANGAFKAVPLPEGRSTVEFEFSSYFDNMLFVFFFLVSIPFLVGILGLGLWQIWQSSSSFTESDALG